ncbi:uncharacterized protein DUF2029 [Brevibacterium sanguinis]|uniref:Uncharacterized protein DUF2029 n=2 Tax=Brevibacterium TaxID=1696 RepID=A0A366ILZ0_9MICO|nr:MULTISPECIES: glycosyltransferase 87 family protein [Brevibacterium]RBP67231.1 uncharacterized protein DUF2029 [Brevibacterium sanguinis]RBP73756.1 uncharacterized protein DUF2029 [Brevibacterium celere]
MPSHPSTRIAEPLLGGPDGIHLGAAGARFRRLQAFIFAGLLGATTFLALALQAPCLSSGYAQPSASARMCAGPLSTAFLGDLNPEAPGRSTGGAAGLSVLDAALVAGLRALTDDVSVFMSFVLILNVVAIAALGVGLLVLARQRAWLTAVFVSPIILFTLGSTLDPVAVALSVWALIVVLGSPPIPARPWLAGVLLGLAAFIKPLALLVLLALTLAGSHPTRTVPARSPRMMIATAALTSALILILDGSAYARVVHGLTDAVDGGSFASILVMARFGSNASWAPVWIAASAGVVLAVTIALLLVRRRGLDPAVAACLLIGACLLFAPGMMPWDSLWLLPFLVLAVHRWWVLIVWGLAEASFAVASHLGDVAGIDPEAGLEPAFVALFTLLRLFALVVAIIFAAENLHRQRVRAPRRIAVAARTRPVGAGGENPDMTAPARVL